MIFVIHARDKPEALAARMDVLAAHRAHLAEAPAQHGVQVLMSGPLTEDDGDRMKGSFLLLQAESRAQIEDLLATDPMASADVWDGYTLTRVQIRQNAVGPIGEDS